MDSLLFTATSGASRVLKAQHVRSNNLSNADTAGFRADMERVRSVPLHGSGFDGRTMVATNSAMTRFDAGDIVKTGRPLDVAIMGDGYLTVQTPEGQEAYTRAGNIEVDTFGALYVNGFPLMGDNGPLTTFDAKDPTGSQMIDDDEPKGFDAWRKPSALWLIPAAVIAFLVLLLAGRRARRNRQ